MDVQIFENQTKELVNTINLDRELIRFSSVVFTTSSYDFIMANDFYSNVPKAITGESARKVLSLASELHKSYPPDPVTDISGIEEIYE